MKILTARDRPDLDERAAGLAEEVWPEYNKHGAVPSRYWPDLARVFPDFQFVVYDEADDEIVAQGHSIPCAWDGTAEGLPHGIDGLFPDAFALRERGGRANALAALAVEIPPGRQGRGLSGDMIATMRAIARDHDLDALIAPVRPNWKERYPLTPIERYMRWTREDGLPFDPWIRVHHRLGGVIVRAEPRSLSITGTVAEWEHWTEMRFPESGDYVFPHGLAPLTVDVEADAGRYWEPNVWMHHRVPESESPGPA